MVHAEFDLVMDRARGMLVLVLLPRSPGIGMFGLSINSPDLQVTLSGDEVEGMDLMPWMMIPKDDQGFVNLAVD